MPPTTPTTVVSFTRKVTVLANHSALLLSPFTSRVCSRLDRTGIPSSTEGTAVVVLLFTVVTVTVDG